MTDPEVVEVAEPKRRLRVYRAEDRAAAQMPARPLDGTREAAQAYVDRITRSGWWRRECPPSWLGDHEHDKPLGLLD